MRKIDFEEVFQMKELEEGLGWDFSKVHEWAKAEAHFRGLDTEEAGEAFDKEKYYQELLDNAYVLVRIVKNEDEERATYDIGPDSYGGWGNTVSEPLQWQSYEGGIYGLYKELLELKRGGKE